VTHDLKLMAWNVKYVCLARLRRGGWVQYKVRRLAFQVYVGLHNRGLFQRPSRSVFAAAMSAFGRASAI
jgi:hypothetical protein